MYRKVRMRLMVCALVLVALSLSGCGGSGNEFSSSANGATGSSQASGSAMDVKDGDVSKQTVEMSEGTAFSDGLAWVKCRDTETFETFYACVDTNGEVRFSIPVRPTQNNFSFPTSFENGCSYLIPISGVSDEGYESIGIIDSDGNVTTFGDEDGVLVVAYGGGYVVLERHEEVFDTDAYTYEIRDAHGDLVETLNTEDYAAFSGSWYCGQGVFGFQVYPNAGCPTCFFCCSTGTLVEEPASMEVEFAQGSDTAVIGVEDNELVLLSSTGETFTKPLPDGMRRVTASPVSEGICVLYADGGIYAYSLNDGACTQLSDEYAQRVTSDNAVFYDGRCVLSAKGDDGEFYTLIFDTQWNLITEPLPVMCNEYARYSDDLFSVQYDGTDNSGEESDTFEVYDLEGNVVFTLDHPAAPCEEGVMVSGTDVSYGAGYRGFCGIGNVEYLDSEGSILFDTPQFTDDSQEIELDAWDVSQ